uniref:WD repeat-containing protein 1 n=1 Tax=Hydra vulgaris TaxID=6087 RepID=T2MIR7_HYDVU
MSEDGSYTLLNIFAGTPRTTRGRPIHLSADPKGKNFLYCQGNSIIIRDVENPSNSDVYTQHAKDTTSAAYSPSGFYICSADVTGKVRIWDTVNKDHILKYEYPALGGPIKDIAWTEDSKRIGVCGEGREKAAHVFMWDTGTSVGELTGPLKACNNISIKQTRPYRLVVSSEDYSTCYYEGPPFKLKSQFREHTSFANCVRFSPDGNKFVSAGSDGRCFVHDGKTGDLIGEMCSAQQKVHNGGIYGISWSPDSKMLMTCSADKTVKIWNMDDLSSKEVVSFEMGKTIDDMQVGCLWVGDNIISVSLSGNINYLDMKDPSKPKRVVKGHNKAIVASCLNEDRTLLFTASFEGLTCYWDLVTGVAEYVQGEAHKNQVMHMECKNDTIVTCGMDDTVRFITVSEKKYSSSVVALSSQPRGCAIGNLGLSIVVCVNSIIVIQDGKVAQKYSSLSFDPTCVAISCDLAKVAVGTEESKVVIYDIIGSELKQHSDFPTNGNVTCIQFSPDNKFLAISTGKKQVKVVLTSDFKTEQGNWASHSGKVNSIDWTPNSHFLASAGIDGAVYVWDVVKGDASASLRGAHSQSVDVTSVRWSDNNTLLTCGRQDCCVRKWNIKH